MEVWVVVFESFGIFKGEWKGITNEGYFSTFSTPLVGILKNNVMVMIQSILFPTLGHLKKCMICQKDC